MHQYVQTQQWNKPKTVFVQLLQKLSLLPSYSSTSFPRCWLVNVQRFEAVFLDTCYLKAASVDTTHLRACFDSRNSVSMRSVTREFLLESAHLISLLPNVHLHVHLTLRKLVDEDTSHPPPGRKWAAFKHCLVPQESEAIKCEHPNKLVW